MAGNSSDKEQPVTGRRRKKSKADEVADVPEVSSPPDSVVVALTIRLRPRGIGAGSAYYPDRILDPRFWERRLRGRTSLGDPEISVDEVMYEGPSLIP